MATSTVPWWKRYGVTQAFGVHGEQGTDYGLPFHTAVTLPIAGRVSREGCYGYGCEVDVRASLPGVGTVTEYVIHLDTIAAGIVQGAELPAGAFLGLSGGETTAQVAAGMFKGAQHPAGTQFSTGPHIEEGFVLGGRTPFLSGDTYLNPAPILSTLTGTGGASGISTACADCIQACGNDPITSGLCLARCGLPGQPCFGLGINGSTSTLPGPGDIASEVSSGFASGLASAGNSLLHVFGFTSATDAAWRVTLVVVGIVVLLFGLFKLFEKDISAVA